MAPVELEEQQEKLRRTVEDWRSRSHDLLKNLRKGSLSANDESRSDLDPVRVIATPMDHSSVSTLIESENVAVAKFVTVLSYDCIEISKLSRYAHRNIYKKLLLFGCGSSSREALLEGEPQKAFGHSFSLFMELAEITSQMSAVTCNLLYQLDSIYSLQDKSGTPCNSFKDATLPSVFDSLGDSLAMFLILDQILVQNGRIRSYLSLFARMWNEVKLDAENFGFGIGDLDCIGQVVSHLENLLNVGVFQRLLRDSSWVDILHKIKRNKKFHDACTSFIHDGLSEILQRIDTRKESLSDRRKILHYVALLLFGTYASAEVPERRLGTVVMEMLQVLPVIYFESGFRFVLLDILRCHFSESSTSWSILRDAAREHDAVKKKYLTHVYEIYSRDWQAMISALASLMASFQSSMPPMFEQSQVEAFLRLHFKQIMQGIVIARRMQLMASSMLDLHTLLEVPIKRERLKSICHMIVLMKVIKSMFQKKELDIIQSLPLVINLVQADIGNLLLMAKDKLQSEIAKGSQASKIRILSSFIRGGKDADTSQFDSLSLVSIALKMLQGGGSNVRLLSLLISLDALQSIGYLDFEYSRIKKLVSKVATVADFQRIVEEVTDCSFLYWRKEMPRTWFSMIYTDGNKFSWLQYVLDACADGLWLLKLGNVGEFTLHLHEEEIENAVKTEIIAPLCRDIETDLRLHVHSIHLKGSVRVNPRKTGVSNLSWYLELKPLRLPFKCIDLKSHVKRYLNSVFYNHSAMSSYDCKIYSDMKHLAELKYGMVLDDAHLPVCLDHELEVIEIVHNLQNFTKSYSYNMINQVFIEKISSSQGQKTLRVLGVGNVVNSVTVHGVGIISTASDSVTAFLTQKITDLSGFLQDNVVSFHSFKEFNFRKVESHNLVMRKLPFGENEMWFLEQLLCIITEMGNAIGLLRVLQTGGSRHICSVSQFILKKTSIQSFAEISQNLDFVDGTVLAGKLMDLAVKNRHQTDEWMKSLPSLLVELSKGIKDGRNIFFRDFYLIIPALIISRVDLKIKCKDNNFRRLQSVDYEMARDDGFMMGAAFILKVMEQEKFYDALHWLSGVSKKLDEALLSLEETRHREQRKDSVGLAALKLWGQSATPVSSETQKDLARLMEYQKELELINSGICVARTLML